MSEKQYELRRWGVVLLLLMLSVVAIVWCAWPGEYSPADPRSYVPYEQIPVEQYDTAQFIKAGQWDFETLKKYGIRLFTFDHFPEDPVERENWILWSNRCVCDFLARMMEKKPAVLRSAMREAGTGVSYSLHELRYVRSDPASPKLTIIYDTRRSTDNLHEDEPQYFRTEGLQYFCRSAGGGRWWYFIKPVDYEVYGGPIHYLTGYDPEMDEQFESLVAWHLETGGLVEIPDPAANR